MNKEYNSNKNSSYKDSSNNIDIRTSSSQSSQDLYRQGYVKKKGCNCGKNN